MSDCQCDFSRGQWSCRCGALAREKARKALDSMVEEFLPQEERREFSMEEGLFHGWFSLKQRDYALRVALDPKRASGVFTYYDLERKPVLVTEVTRSARASQWDDAVYVGVVQMDGTFWGWKK